MKLSRWLIFWLCCLPVAAFAGQTLVQYAGLPPGASAKALGNDGSGNVFVAAQVTEDWGAGDVQVIKMDSRGKTLASIKLGTSATIGGLAVDATGDVVMVGSASATGFPLKAPLISTVNPPQSASFVAKFDSGLTTVLFSTLLGGTQGGGTSASAVATDSAGNIYVAGGTGATNFPVTPGAFQQTPPPYVTGPYPTYAFLSEISSDGQHLIFSTYFGNSGVTCTGATGSSCVFLRAGTYATAIALDSAGDITIGGNTTANNLPVTANAFALQCGCGTSQGGGARVAGFLAQFAPGGSTLRWATYFPAGGPNIQSTSSLNGIALDSSGDVVLAGAAPSTLATSTGALQTTYPGQGLSAGFVAKLDATGQNLLFSTYFGGGSPDGFSNGSVGGVAVDSSGLVWITGSASPQQLPVPQGTALLGSTYVAALSSDGTSVSYAMTAPSGAAGQAITTEAGGAVLALGTGNSVLVTTAGQGASLAGIANSAGSAVSNVVAPDEIISLYGVGIGPAQAATAQVVNGVLPNSLSGVRVLFDGTAAPLLYAGPTQINAIVPRAVANQNSTTIQVVTPSGTIAGLTLLQRPAAPNVFANFGVLPNDALSPFALALNQDGSINSLSNPAAAGSVVSVWATGTGLSTTAWPDGSIMNQNYGSAALPVSVLWFPPGQSGGDSLQVLYAGDAPGDVAGVSQVNFALPHAATNQTLFKLQVGTALSGSFSVYVQ